MTASTTNTPQLKHTWSYIINLALGLISIIWCAMCIIKIHTLNDLKHMRIATPVQTAQTSQVTGLTLLGLEKIKITKAELLQDGYIETYKFYIACLVLLFVAGVIVIKVFEDLAFTVRNRWNHYATPGAVLLFDMILFADWCALGLSKGSIGTDAQRLLYPGVSVSYWLTILLIFVAMGVTWGFIKYFTSTNKNIHDFMYSFLGGLNIIIIGIFNVATLGSVVDVFYGLYIGYSISVMIGLTVYTACRLYYIWKNGESTTGASQ